MCKIAAVPVVQYVLSVSSPIQNPIYVHNKCRIILHFRKEKLSYSSRGVPIGKVTTVYREQMKPVIVFPASVLQAQKGPGACLNLDDPPLSEITDAHPAQLSSNCGKQGVITCCRRQTQSSCCATSTMRLT